MRRLLVVLCFFPLMSFAKDAGVFAEPYAGYFIGETEGTNLGVADLKSYVAGARLGYRTESGWAYGIDYAQGNGDYETTTATYDYTTKDGGIFIGYYFTEYVKVWASYILQYENTIKDLTAVGTDTEAEGDGFNVGIGIRGIPFVTINVTYSERNVDEINGATAGVASDNKVKTTMLSVSLPYNFPWKP